MRSKIVLVGNTDDGRIFCKITYNDGKLSITGVEGPYANGNCKGSCGQIILGFKEYDYRGYKSLDSIVPAEGWDKESIKRFFDIWDRWHLNDMRAGSKVQEQWLRDNPVTGSYDYAATCARLAAVGLNPDKGYMYGTAWKAEKVPAKVLGFLFSLPTAREKPAWI